jgi:hypothetical protein
MFGSQRRTFHPCVWDMAPALPTSLTVWELAMLNPVEPVARKARSRGKEWVRCWVSSGQKAPPKVELLLMQPRGRLLVTVYRNSIPLLVLLLLPAQLHVLCTDYHSLQNTAPSLFRHRTPIASIELATSFPNTLPNRISCAFKKGLEQSLESRRVLCSTPPGLGRTETRLHMTMKRPRR